MPFLLFVTAAVLSIISFVTGNDTVFTVSWVVWFLAVLLVLRNRRVRFRYSTPEKLRAAIAEGDVRALRATAMLAKINKDLDEAERLLRLAVDRGDREAMWEMGRLVEERDGLAASERWFRMAAENGHFFAKRFFRPGHALNMDGTNPL